MNKILIKNAYIIDSENNENIFKADVLIKNQYIYKISTKNINIDNETRIIDAKNKLVLPGLINCHTHIPMTLFRGYADDLPLGKWLNEKIFPAESKLNSRAVFFGSLLGIIELIRSGCTTIADMYFYLDDIVKAIDISGLRGILSLGVLDNKGNEALFESEKYFNKYNESLNGRIKIYLGPHAPYTCNPGFLKKISSLAKNLKTGVHIHLNETKKEISDYGKNYNSRPIVEIEKTGIFKSKTIAAHCVHLDKEEMNILKNNDVLVAHNPSSNLKLASGIASIQKLIDMKIKVGLGTDGAASNNQLNLWQELRLSALLSKVKTMNAGSLPALEAFRMASITPGEYLWNGSIGQIKENKLADLIIINTENINLKPCPSFISNLVYAMYGNEVDTVIIDGKIVMEEKKIVNFDEKEIIKEAISQSEIITGKKSFFAI